MIVCIEENDLYHAIDESLTAQLRSRLGPPEGAKLAGGLTDIARNVSAAVVVAGTPVVVPQSAKQDAGSNYAMMFRGIDDVIADHAVMRGSSAAETERLRSAASALCRVLSCAFNGDVSREASPEYAATAAGRLVQLVRELTR